jgi:hypothetical protein
MTSDTVGVEYQNRAYLLQSGAPCAKREVSKALRCIQWWNLFDPTVQGLKQSQHAFNALFHHISIVLDPYIKRKPHYLKTAR